MTYGCRVEKLALWQRPSGQVSNEMAQLLSADVRSPCWPTTRRSLAVIQNPNDRLTDERAICRWNTDRAAAAGASRARELYIKYRSLAARVLLGTGAPRAIVPLNDTIDNASLKVI